MVGLWLPKMYYRTLVFWDIILEYLGDTCFTNMSRDLIEILSFLVLLICSINL